MNTPPTPNQSPVHVITATPNPLTTGSSRLDPATMWRAICWVTPTIALSGDLDLSRRQRGEQQLDSWIDAGITDIIDVRGERNDAEFVREYAPFVRYHWFGTHDAGYTQSDDWFEAGVLAAQSALADPNRKVLIHCHMGVNRGPSMGFAVMLSQGFDPIEALEAISTARPIAGIIYAGDAIDWWHRTQETPQTIAFRERKQVRDWMRARKIDVSWVISRIARSDAS